MLGQVGQDGSGLFGDAVALGQVEGEEPGDGARQAGALQGAGGGLGQVGGEHRGLLEAVHAVLAEQSGQPLPEAGLVLGLGGRHGERERHPVVVAAAAGHQGPDGGRPVVVARPVRLLELDPDAGQPGRDDVLPVAAGQHRQPQVGAERDQVLQGDALRGQLLPGAQRGVRVAVRGVHGQRAGGALVVPVADHGPGAGAGDRRQGRVVAAGAEAVAVEPLHLGHRDGREDGEFAADPVDDGAGRADLLGGAAHPGERVGEDRRGLRPEHPAEVELVAPDRP